MQLLKYTWCSWHIFINAFLYDEEDAELSKYQPAPCSWLQHTEACCDSSWRMARVVAEAKKGAGGSSKGKGCTFV
jgi:hypothetical protein